jgi:hypothetical protein
MHALVYDAMMRAKLVIVLGIRGAGQPSSCFGVEITVKCGSVMQ